jgi:rRNA maturation protein Nop10
MPVRACGNDNHGRRIVTVRFCPSCGTVLNDTIAARRCPDASHAQMRRDQSTYCMHCGERLVLPR